MLSPLNLSKQMNRLEINSKQQSFDSGVVLQWSDPAFHCQVNLQMLASQVLLQLVLRDICACSSGFLLPDLTAMHNSENSMWCNITHCCSHFLFGLCIASYEFAVVFLK